MDTHSLKHERSSNLVRRETRSASSVNLVELLGVECDTERGLDACTERLRVAENEEARVVDLGLDERGVLSRVRDGTQEDEDGGTHVEVSLSSDLEADVRVGRLGVPDGLGAGLDVLVHLVVVRGGEDGEVGEAVHGDRVRGRGVTGSDRVAGDGARWDGVGRLGAEEEAVTSDDLERSAELDTRENARRRR